MKARAPGLATRAAENHSTSAPRHSRQDATAQLRRSPRFRRLVDHLHALGPRPVGELLIDDRLREEHDRVLAELAEWSRRIGSLHGEIRDELVEEQPDLSEFEWPDPSEPDEDPDPLFDARRSYLDQVDRFKRHQGKRTAKRPSRWGKANGGGAEP